MALLRAGCASVIKDAEFLAEADKIKADFSFRSGEAVQTVVAELMKTPPDTIATVKRYMNYKEEGAD